MGKPTYWLDLFTWKTWQEFLNAGGSVSGFKERRGRTVRRIQPGDVLICYLTGVSRFIGLLEVTSDPYHDTTPIWEDDAFPWRLRVRVSLALTPETAVPVQSLRDELSFFQDMKSPNSWTGFFRGSPAKWKLSDAEAVVAAMREAERNPVVREVDPRKLDRRPRGLDTKTGDVVTVPEANEFEEEPTSTESDLSEATQHTTIQYLLLKLGKDMGFSVWVASNDRNREYNGQKLGETFGVLGSLPLQFDEATTKTIEYIDVIWLRGNAIVAAFEVESTTSIYSGLLRMSDLISMQPNLNIPLYLVAPDERRNKVFAEVNRPTFSRLSPPLVDMCRYIAFSTLEERLRAVAPYIQYLKPEFLDELAEICEIEE